MKKIMINTLKAISEKRNWPKALSALLLLALVGQLFQLAGNAYNISAPKLIIAATDDDAANGIGVAVKSKWWNDNTFRAYGNFYYRVAHTLEKISPFKVSDKKLTPLAAQEKGSHFYLIFINIFSLYFAIWLISRFISGDLNIRLLYTLTLMAMFIHQETWSVFISRPHPELFFSLFLIIAAIFTYKMLLYPHNKKYIKYSALLWGIASGIKLTSLLYAPSILFLILRKGSVKQNYQRVLQYLGFILLGYFAIGFPQNFIIHKTLRTLLSMGKYAQPTSLYSIQEWISIFKEQMLLPIGLTLIFVFLFTKKKPFKTPARFYSLFLIPFLILITRNTTLSHKHYTFSFILLFMLMIPLFLPQTPLFIKNIKVKYLAILTIFLGTRLSIGFVPKTLSETFYKITPCRTEIEQAANIVHQVIQKSDKVLADPYTPVEDYKRQDQVRKLWDHTLEDIDKKVQLIILNSNFYSRYTTGDDVSIYVKTDIPKWKDVRKYYQLFKGQKEIIDPNGRSWKQVFNKCYLEIWTPSK
jgi:hypothetical protein